MPELPEVEHVRRTLEPRLIGRGVDRVALRRAEVVRGERAEAALLAGQRIARLERRGKQLALVGERGATVCVHLGMTGSLRWEEARKREAQSQKRGGEAVEGPVCGGVSEGEPDPHVHVVWELEGGARLAFRDPRRFGGIWTYPGFEALVDRRWGRLGEDALTVKPMGLWRRLQGTRRAVKAALLDQAVVAGLGNIYVDELLFGARIAPLRPANGLERGEVRRLVRWMRRVLGEAIEAGGSTLRDYVDGEGQRGGYQDRHRVYGRGGEPCRACRSTLLATVVGGRTTVYCGRCQVGAGFGERLEERN